MRFLAVVWGLVLFNQPAVHALSVSPTRIIIEDDTGSRSSLRLSGVHGPVAIEVVIVERLPNGQERPVPETLARVNPPQLLLEKDEARYISIDIASKIAQTRARSFYLRIEQLDLRRGPGADDESHEIDILATYLLPVHVLGGHLPDVSAEFTGPSETLEVSLNNGGAGPALLSDCTMTVVPREGTSRIVEGRKLARQFRTDAILPAETIEVDLSAVTDVSEPRSGDLWIGAHLACDPEP